MTSRPNYRYCLATSYSSGTLVRLPSALRSLTSVFGMGTGVTSLPLSPDKWNVLYIQN